MVEWEVTELVENEKLRVQQLLEGSPEAVLAVSTTESGHEAFEREEQSGQTGPHRLETADLSLPRKPVDKCAESERVEREMALDFNVDGGLIGIEILGPQDVGVRSFEKATRMIDDTTQPGWTRVRIRNPQLHCLAANRQSSATRVSR
jgi:hypothetical protein